MKASTLEPVQARVICKCGSESCFQCGEIWHDAITCALLAKWKRICVDDFENAEWLYFNTKKCPKCTYSIEKDGGCNHLQCKSCGHHFCWICRSEWHQLKTCNKFVQTGEDITARLIHYSTRYTNHIESLKLERGIYDSVVQKMPFLTAEEVAEGTSTDITVLKRAVQSLRRSRQILISTYVFAYYSVHCNQLTIFEDNQSDLEKATENLSWLLERGISSERWVEVKQRLQVRYEYCDKRRCVLLEHIKEGYQNDYWKLNDD
ncbi:hypothetical protein HA402_009401 [Bradysia odoriphaga]|nr:hypothetical protein HA402_009401 [Bradysia odoriphaga]